MRKNSMRELLKEELKLLEKSLVMLNYSLQNCQKIGIKSEYSMPELSEFEALAGRYSRSSDILTQKIIKTLFIILQEDTKFFIDRCNLSEKMGFVDSSDDLYAIRKLRNDIAHEYCIVDITEIFIPLLENSRLLLDIVDRVKGYIREKKL
jgi:uncharacterized protein YutE (UPF0331/DUF86 family)